MIVYTIYQLSSGLIRCTGFSSTLTDVADVVLPSGTGIIEGDFDGVTMYVSAGEVIERPVNPTTINKTSITANGTDSFTLLDYPTGAMVWISGPLNYVNVLSVGNDSFVTTIAGDYTVRVTLPPYLDKEFIVNAS